MWGFGKQSKKLQAVKQQMGRLINDTFSASQLVAEEQAIHGRADTRCVRNLPCVLFLAEQLESPNSYATGVTLDLSLQGLSLLTYETLNSENYAIAVGSGDKMAFLIGSCRYCRPVGLGACTAGFVINEVLETSASSNLKRAIEVLEHAAV